MQKYLALLLIALTSSVRAVDTTPPTLNITHTWIEKAGTRANFKMLLDPADETGLLPLTFGAPIPSNNTIWFRSALNNPNANLSSLAWNWWPWQRGVPFEIGFTCKSCVIEIQARDACGECLIGAAAGVSVALPILFRAGHRCKAGRSHGSGLDGLRLPWVVWWGVWMARDLTMCCKWIAQPGW
jgi:hypothetical protein